MLHSFKGAGIFLLAMLRVKRHILFLSLLLVLSLGGYNVLIVGTLIPRARLNREETTNTKFWRKEEASSK